MAKVTFSDATLCRAWNSAAKSDPKGTRGDVVRKVMEEAGIEVSETNEKRTYNNVTQRVKQLEKKGVSFPELASGRRGPRKSSKDIEQLQSLLND